MSDEHRAETGAFYTPKMWANLAVKYLQKELGDLSKYLFYDPCAGEGALLEALPQGVDVCATTLEWQDVEILRSKGIPAAQFNMLCDEDVEMLPAKILYARKPVVIFTNPPFMKLPAAMARCYARETYPICNDATALILLRLAYEFPHCCIATFSKMDLFQAPALENVRKLFPYKSPKEMFVCSSETWGLKGKFPIAFSVWR